MDVSVFYKHTILKEYEVTVEELNRLIESKIKRNHSFIFIIYHMNHLNYFFPYQSKQDYHEDQLTRAFMVVLKHSSFVANIFYDMCKQKFDETNLNAAQKLSHLSKFISEDWVFDTQKSNPEIETKQLLSVLITDMPLESVNGNISPSTRWARYDGIIKIGSEITIIIENKPNSLNVWFDQLSPSRENLSQETEVLTTHILIQWKDIIIMLTGLLKKGSLQNQLIDDFLSYIDTCFPTLNPYDKLGLCKGNLVLLERRIKNILEKIVIDKNSVQYHRGWAYNIELNLPQIKKIGLVLKAEKDDWWLELAMIAGNTTAQCKSLYQTINDLNAFDLNDLHVRTDFHCSFITTNLIWFKSPETSINNYIQYWKEHPNEMKQYNVEKIDEYLYQLNNNEIIVYNQSEKDRFDEVLYCSTINLCPGLGLFWEIESKDAISYDEEGKFEQLIADKIHLALEVFGTSTDLINRSV